MSRHRWHILRDGNRLVVARSLPPRFDVVAQTQLPSVRRLSLAHQVRQDIWRALQSVRGFSPVVEVTRSGEQLLVRAGGRAPHPIAANLGQRLQDVLDDTANRRRWLRHAGGI